MWCSLVTVAGDTPHCSMVPTVVTSGPRIPIVSLIASLGDELLCVNLFFYFHLSPDFQVTANERERKSLQRTSDLFQFHIIIVTSTKYYVTKNIFRSCKSQHSQPRKCAIHEFEAHSCEDVAGSSYAAKYLTILPTRKVLTFSEKICRLRPVKHRSI